MIAKTSVPFFLLEKICKRARELKCGINILNDDIDHIELSISGQNSITLKDEIESGNINIEV